MAHSLISTSLLKIISSRYAENAKRPGKPPFPDVQAHFHRYEARSIRWTSRAPRRRVAPAQTSASRSLVSGRAHRSCIDDPEQGLTDGRHAGEAKDVPFEAADAMRSKVPSVDQPRHNADCEAALRTAKK
jgi:hypothetical protein